MSLKELKSKRALRADTKLKEAVSGLNTQLSSMKVKPPSTKKQVSSSAFYSQLLSESQIITGSGPVNRRARHPYLWEEGQLHAEIERMKALERFRLREEASQRITQQRLMNEGT